MDAAAEVWLILPTYNEADNVEALVGAVRDQLPASRRILVVDDSSPDGTGRIADRIAAEHPTSRSCTGRARRASAPPTSPAFAARWPAGRS